LRANAIGNTFMMGRGLEGAERRELKLKGTGPFEFDPRKLKWPPFLAIMLL